VQSAGFVAHATRRELTGLKLIPAVIFLSAFLLFQVQPLLSKSLLPWFGGTAGVWTVCMLFFQTGLLAGYAYAHLLIRYAPPRIQAVIHVAVLGAAILTLPIIPSPALKPSGSEDPAWHLLTILALSAGVPYVALAATSPLLQSWVSRSQSRSSPYPLFALSNLGSFAALLSYPFIVEPFLPVSSQGWWWSAAFIVQAVGCGAVAIAAASLPGKVTRDAASAPRPGLPRYLLWLLQSAAGTIVLLEITNFLCLEVAVVPLLWVLPLALYLLSFVLAFDRDRWYSRRIWLSAMFLVAIWVLAAQVIQQGSLLLILGWSALLFCACMLCHGELATSRPHPDYLTGFYLTAAAGGALGGVLVGLAATRLFADYLDLPLGLLLPLLVVALALRDRDREASPAKRRMSMIVVALTIVALVVVPPFVGVKMRSRAIDRARNFFGVIRVSTSDWAQPPDTLRSMFNGHTLHGSQFQSAQRRSIPTAYYGPDSGAGLVLRHFKPDGPRRIGILGLGVGTLAAYGRPGDTIRFYEINPEVTTFARQYFTWLRDSGASISVATGDARIVLEREPGQRYDILIADVYSGGTIPVHLFTTEAFATYLRHLAPDGVLALHVSNAHLDLAPLAFAMSRHFGLAAGFVSDPGDRANGALASRYVLLSRNPRSLSIPAIHNALDDPPEFQDVEPWTDSRNSLLQALVW
jgi:hypothetical protein